MFSTQPKPHHKFAHTFLHIFCFDHDLCRFQSRSHTTSNIIEFLGACFVYIQSQSCNCTVPHKVVMEQFHYLPGLVS